MNIIVAPSAGFCFGVKRAVKMAVDASKTCKLSEKLNTLGPIIHNPQVVKSLEEKGVYPVDNIEDNGYNTIIIRSHGVKSDIMEKLKLKGVKTIDATCPFVKQAQNYITMAALDGYFIIMVGDKNHPEVQSVISFADKNRFLIINGLDDLKNIPVSEKLALISQTTQDVNFYNSVINEIFKIAKKEIVVFNTICDATKLKQDESKVLASNVDVMIVVGGYNSANTNKLKNICAAIQKNTYHIETEKEVNPGWFINADMVGITAELLLPTGL
jgi:(E)-4-hydroxy-3-methyl-but-2-enyl pyrophosphate reductase (IPP and DMAPP forming)